MNLKKMYQRIIDRQGENEVLLGFVIKKIKVCNFKKVSLETRHHKSLVEKLQFNLLKLFQ